MRAFFAGMMTVMLLVPASAQQPFNAGQRIFVTAMPQDPVQIAAGRPSAIDFRFRVASGLHINSHKPLEDYLIPTTFTVASASGVKLGAVDYPTGEQRTFAFSSTEKLDVYTGDIAVHLHLTAQPGEHVLNATLRYQACDNRACYPPRTVPVKLVVEAK